VVAGAGEGAGTDELEPVGLQVDLPAVLSEHIGQVQLVFQGQDGGIVARVARSG
jgi:hypothetical protein